MMNQAQIGHARQAINAPLRVTVLVAYSPMRECEFDQAAQDQRVEQGKSRVDCGENQRDGDVSAVQA
jgi:hypothetical protein